jgi:hypothetical protein
MMTRRSGSTGADIPNSALLAAGPALAADGKHFVSSFNTTNLSTTELVVDIVVTSTATSGDFVRVPSTATIPNFQGYHQSSHISRNRALGGNILFMDMHVEWRKFESMKARYQVGGTPVFWF